MKKQTAIEWLYELSKERELDKFDLEQAKEIEKEQIIEAANYGCDEWMSLEDRYRQGELYYNETYEN